MRIHSLFGAAPGIAIFLAAALFAQNSAHVKQVSVREEQSAIEVEIHTSGTISSPNTQAITGPDRIVIDFPGAVPASDLHALRVNRGPLRGVRSGLFFSNPPITRIVLDLSSAQSYQIVQSSDGFVVKLGGQSETQAVALLASAPAVRIGGARLTTVASVSAVASVSGTSLQPAAQSNVKTVVAAAQEPQKPAVSVDFQNGMLRIHADKATLAQVLFEVQRQTHAEIAIPSGAEQEQVVTDLGPAPPRDVLASLLNGSSYNFIFVGNEQDGSLGKVILSRREPGF